MHFADTAEITIISGHGGNGMISYRREKFIPKGGPHGGNGGNGGSIIFRVNPNSNTLSDFRKKKVWKAQNGESGMTWDKYGKHGEDLILEVPEGTIVKSKESGKVLADITAENPEYTAAVGGRGGYGNAHFKSSTRQCPKFAELGDIGQEFELEMELKMIADIGIIGMPSVGKSTLISVISNAKPKIADYPFTTLVPNRGIVEFKERTMLVCDTPGLIEGASEGKGLGHQFLKHIERTAGLVHLLDGTKKPEEIANEYKAIRKELETYSKDLATKPEMIVINKIDVVVEEGRDNFIKECTKLIGKDFLYISAATHEGINDFLERLFKFRDKYISPKEVQEEISITGKDIDEDGNEYLIQEEKTPENKKEEFKVYKPHEENVNLYWVEKIKDGVFEVHGERIEQIARMTMWSVQQGVERMYDVMEKRGIDKELHKLGAKENDKIIISGHELEYRER